MCLDSPDPILIRGLCNPPSLIFLMPDDASQTFIFLSLSIFICLFSTLSFPPAPPPSAIPPAIFIMLFAS